MSRTSKKPLTKLLTKQDVEKLLYDPCHTVRGDIASQIAKDYGEGLFTGEQREMVVDIFMLLARDTEVRVRKALADTLTTAPELPDTLVQLIINDLDDISLPFIQGAYAISEEDLVELASATERTGVLLAIARRETLSSPVVRTLLQANNDNVTRTVVANPGAAMDENAVQTILQQHPHNESILEALVDRGGLPIKIVERLIFNVSTQLRERLVNRYKLSPETVSRMISSASEWTALSIIPKPVDKRNLAAMLRQMQKSGRLTPSVVIRALCNGDIDFFEAAMGVMANVPIANAQKLLQDKGSLGFKALYDAADMPESFLEIIKALYGFARKQVGRKDITLSTYHHRLIEQVRQGTLGQPVSEYADYIVSLIMQERQQPGQLY